MGRAVLDGDGLLVGEGDLLVGEGDGVAETVAVTVTGGTGDGPDGVGTAAPADSWGAEPPRVSRNTSSGARATPSTAEVTTKRRDGCQVPDGVRPLVTVAPASRAPYAVPAHGSSPSAKALPGVSRSAHSSSYAVVQCGQCAM